MTGTLDYGTAVGNDIPCPAAGKTGTTEEQADAWFVGFTPHVSTAVWVGNPNERVPLPGYGAQLAAPIWHDYMLVAASQPCDDFPPPQNPASLSPFYGEHTASAPDSGGTYGDETSTTTDETRNGNGDENFDPELYAPGAGQDPLPAPGQGGDQGGGNGGGPTGGGGGPPPPDTGGTTP
jgi:penicillin-binding protein 1A